MQIENITCKKSLGKKYNLFGEPSKYRCTSVHLIGNRVVRELVAKALQTFDHLGINKLFLIKKLNSNSLREKHSNKEKYESISNFQTIKIA